MQTPTDYEYVTKEDYTAVCGPDWPDYKDFCQHLNVPEWVYQEIDQMLPRKALFSHPTWCVNPFYSFEIPGQTHCCLLPKDHNIFEIREKMLAGERPMECNKCWKLEDENLISDRLIKNQSLDFWSDTDLEQLYNQCTEGNFEVLQYKIDTSNHCNSICVTCGSHSSSSWGLLETKNNIIASSNWTIEKNAVDSFVNYKTLKMLSFRGGEPLLSNTNFDILENLLDVNNTDCFISFVTNGSIRPTKRQMRILSNFKNVNFCFSIDGIEKRFEYIRFPLKWENVIENIFWTRNQGYNVSVSYTVSNLNALYHKETVSWFEQNNIPYLVNPVYSPTYFAPSVLPDSAKNFVQQNEEKYRLDDLILPNGKLDHQLWNQFIAEIYKQDSMKQIDINDYMPELASFIKKSPVA